MDANDSCFFAASGQFVPGRIASASFSACCAAWLYGLTNGILLGVAEGRHGLDFYWRNQFS